ncbi:hypothetical protein [Ruegeria atlantica]|uniref:Uncharacterized protein n=1 Tax=Ruegeria atlantica TaxID=81569 RepID=A0A0P1F145_9RHOB|nr:hypothetical protein [Ruegeria atlantica]CUH48475.1 hypothetical protein RUA4292_02655 [Ruegeria atlantica]
MTQYEMPAKKSFTFIFSRGNFRRIFAQVMQIGIVLKQLGVGATQPMQTRIRLGWMLWIDVFVNGQNVQLKTIFIRNAPQNAQSIE